jgi:hypothetical protein
VTGIQRRAAESPGETPAPWLLRRPTSRERDPFWNAGRVNTAILPAAPKSNPMIVHALTPLFYDHSTTSPTRPAKRSRKQNYRIQPGFGMVFTRSSHYSWERMGAMGCFEVG